MEKVGKVLIVAGALTGISKCFYELVKILKIDPFLVFFSGVMIIGLFMIVYVRTRLV